MFPELSGTKFWSHSFHLQNSRILQDRMKQRGDPMKTNFDNFQIQKWISRRARAQNVDEKNGFINLVFLFVFLVMVFKWPKVVHFLQHCADLSKISKSIKAIYLYPSETPHHALSVHSMFYRGLSNNSRDIEEYPKSADSAETQQNSSASNVNIFSTVNHSILANTIFQTSETRTFRYIP